MLLHYLCFAGVIPFVMHIMVELHNGFSPGVVIGFEIEKCNFQEDEGAVLWRCVQHWKMDALIVVLLCPLLFQ